MIATPAVMLSWVQQVQLASHEVRGPCPDDGMTCMTPIALAGETERWSKPDSWKARARASEGSTPMRRAVSATIVFICSRLGTGEAFSKALFWLAELTTAAG